MINHSVLLTFMQRIINHISLSQHGYTSHSSYHVSSTCYINNLPDLILWSKTILILTLRLIELTDNAVKSPAKIPNSNLHYLPSGLTRHKCNKFIQIAATLTAFATGWLTSTGTFSSSTKSTTNPCYFDLCADKEVLTEINANNSFTCSKLPVLCSASRCFDSKSSSIRHIYQCIHPVTCPSRYAHPDHSWYATCIFNVKVDLVSWPLFIDNINSRRYTTTRWHTEYTERASDWMSEWVNGWVSECEWVSEWVSERERKRERERVRVRVRVREWESERVREWWESERRVSEWVSEWLSARQSECECSAPTERPQRLPFLRLILGALTAWK
jgi:hypothetical protein